MRQGRAGGGGACLDGFVDAFEIVPREGLHGGTQDDVRVALPTFELMFLRCANCAADNLENISWSTTLAVMQTNRNSDDDLGA